MHRYSNRLNWSTPVNSFSVRVAEARAAGKPLLDLTISNPTEALDDYPHAAIAEALGSIKSFRYQPAVVVKNVAYTAGTSEAYSALFKLLADPGDEVLVPTPSYPLFDYLAQLDSVILKPYRLAYDGSWFIDFSSLEAALSPKTKAIILVNPNNPTGSFLKSAELERLRKYSLPLISDEVFQDYAFTSNRVSLAAQDEILSFSLNGLSKSAGMPQMKLAWITVNGPGREEALARLELILDTYLSVGTPVQAAAEPLLHIGRQIQRRIQTRLQNNLRSLDLLLENQKVHRLHCEGGWSAILRVPQQLGEEEWITRLLREENVIVQPGYFFDLTGGTFLVVSLLTAEDIFTEGIKRIITQS